MTNTTREKAVTGLRVVCPNCSAMNTVPDYIAAHYVREAGAELECYSCNEREKLSVWNLEGEVVCVGDVY